MTLCDKYIYQGVLYSYGDFKILQSSWNKITSYLRKTDDNNNITNNNPHLHNADNILLPPKYDQQKLQVEVELRNVSFSYPNSPHRLILNNVNLVIPKGKVTALVSKMFEFGYFCFF